MTYVFLLHRSHHDIDNKEEKLTVKHEKIVIEENLKIILFPFIPLITD